MPSPLDRRALLLASASTLAACGAVGRKEDAARATDAEAARAELFSHLRGVAHGQSPIAAEERVARRARAARLLAAHGADAVLVEPGATMSWLTGVSFGRSERLFALLLCADGSQAWICPAFEASRARAKIAECGGEIVAWQEHEHPSRPLAAELERRRVGVLLVENSVRHVHAGRLAREWNGRIALGDAWLVDLRARKDAHELALLRRANELTQLALSTVARTLRPGLSGDEVAARMAAAHAALSMKGSWCLALVGERAALPHGDNSPRPIARGDLLLVDTGATLLEYQSDHTRTWCVEGEPEDEARRAWVATRDAQQAAYAAIKPGARCKDVDAAARATLERAGFGGGYEALTHRLGHGIGVEGHEDPYFDGGSEVVLEPGMTFSDEPGVYREGRFGVRLEDIVVVVEGGADHFGTWPKDWKAP
jgi:Xaa-Pro dipeptidase